MRENQSREDGKTRWDVWVARCPARGAAPSSRSYRWELILEAMQRAAFAQRNGGDRSRTQSGTGVGTKPRCTKSRVGIGDVFPPLPSRPRERQRSEWTVYLDHV